MANSCATWVKRDYLIWYGAKIPHNNEQPEVKKFCGDHCRFPTCMGDIVREDEEKDARLGIPDDTRASQEREDTRAHAIQLRLL